MFQEEVQSQKLPRDRGGGWDGVGSGGGGVVCGCVVGLGVGGLVVGLGGCGRVGVGVGVWVWVWVWGGLGGGVIAEVIFQKYCSSKIAITIIKRCKTSTQNEEQN